MKSARYADVRLRHLCHQVSRRTVSILGRVRSHMRVVGLRLRYPAIDIDFATHISPGCDIACSDNSRMVIRRCYLSRGVLLRADAGGHLEMQSTFVGPNSVLVAQHLICIERGCEIAEMCVIRDQDHRPAGCGTLATSGFNRGPIRIEREVWIGAGATVLKSTTVGSAALIGAGSVVTKDVPAGGRVAGIPARAL